MDSQTQKLFVGSHSRKKKEDPIFGKWNRDTPLKREIGTNKSKKSFRKK